MTETHSIKNYKTLDDISSPAFIERSNELEKLISYFQSTMKGYPAFVIINGQFGLGKKRLISEFKKVLPDKIGKEKKVTFIEWECKEADGERYPFRPIVYFLYRIYRTFGVLDQLTGKVESISGFSNELIEFAFSNYDEENLENIFDKIEDDPKKIFAQLTSYLYSHASSHPIFLILENIQWIDRKSSEFIEYLVCALRPKWQFFLLGTYHGDEKVGENNFQKFISKLRICSAFNEILLSPLSLSGLEDLFASMLDGLQIQDKQLSKIYKITNGNPYYAIEFLKTLVERKRIYRHEEGCTVELNDEDLSVIPEGVKESLIRKLPKLGKKHLQTLYWSSLMAFPWRIELMIRLIDIPSNQFLFILGDLLRDQYLIEDSKDGRENLYQISHPGIGNAVLEMNPNQDIKKAHLTVGKSIEKLFEVKSLTDFESMAYHFFRGDDLKRTRKYSITAGDLFMAQRGFDQAAKYYNQVLEISQKSKKDDDIAQAFSLVGMALTRQGNYRDGLKNFKEAQSRAKSSADIFLIKKGFGLCYHGLYIFDKAMDFFKEAQNSCKNGPDPELLIKIATIELYNRKFSRSQEILDKAVASVQQRREDTLEADMNQCQGWLWYYTGKWEKAREAFNIAHSLFSKIKNHLGMADTLLGEAYIALYSESIQKYSSLLENAMSFIKNIKDNRAKLAILEGFGVLYERNERLDKAYKQYKEIQDIAQNEYLEREEIIALNGMGRVMLNQGKKLEEIEDIVSSGIKKAEESHDTFLAAEAYHLLSLLYLREGRDILTKKFLKFALDSYRKLGVPWKEVRVIIDEVDRAIKNDEFDYAQEIIQEIKNRSKEINDKESLGKILLLQAQLSYKCKDYARAIKRADKALKIFKDMGNKEQIRKAKSLYINLKK